MIVGVPLPNSYKVDPKRIALFRYMHVMNL